MSESKKSSWKDSNWYMSLTGFWKEYRRHKIGILGIIVLLFYVGMAVGAPWLATHDPSPNNTVAPEFLAPGWMSVFDPTGVITDQYMPDRELTEAPEFELIGDSTDFSYEHYVPDGGNGRVNLTWEHTAGTEITLQDPYDTGPQLLDPIADSFIVFKQEVEWPFEGLPEDVNISLTYATTLTGDFLTEERGGLMFRAYIWFIDDSGNWMRVFESNPPYADYFQTRIKHLSFFDIRDTFGGMVVDENNVQEDERDVFTVAFGLVPSETFFEDSVGDYEHPYLNYTGGVEITVEELGVIAHGGYFGVLGTTDKGGDAWSQLVFGSRISLTIGILATALSTAVGVIVGLTAGYFGGKTDEILMRVVDFLLVIPGLPLMMVLAAFLGPTIENIIVVISILGWTGTSRLIRSQVMAEKNKAYVESARAIGASDTYIIFRHILPNVTPILFANITLGVVGAILSESGLAFLGLTDPNEPSWGRMIADAQGTGGFSQGAWWVVVFPGLMITILSLAFTFVGHTLDQVLNPRLRER
ncbi:MAG: ABC transporter permease subunit [Candidatus Lokiarchaeota archaeon]|nr:ABC transporter permease subunit [Candidatus Lokiarchaeota archaeon]